MALDQQLKSKSSAIMPDASRKKESEKTVIDPIFISDFDDTIPISEPKIESQTVNVPALDQISMLLSIESQLKGLNDNILNLRHAIDDRKNSDLQTVFTKIDDARTSVETLISKRGILPVRESETNTSQALILLHSILEKQEKNDRQLVQALRDNANFQIQVRQGMQRDLDMLKEQMNGEQFNPLLKEIATVYVEYQSLLTDDTMSDRSRKNLLSLFEQLEDVLREYDAVVYRSVVGSVRQTKICKIIEKIPTDQQEMHNTIAVSRKPGVIRNRSVLYPEYVDVFVYDQSLVEVSTHTIESVENVKESKELIESATASENTRVTIFDAPNNNNLGGNK